MWLILMGQNMDLAILRHHHLQQIHPLHTQIRIPYALHILRVRQNLQAADQSLFDIHSRRPHNMAFGLCNAHDPDHGSMHHHARFPQTGPHDRPDLPA